MSPRRQVNGAPQRAGGKPVAASRFGYWLKNVTLTTSAISGVLALIPKAANAFGPFDHVVEVLLGICVAGIMMFALTLVQAEASQRKLGITLLVVAPVFGLVLWYTELRLPPAEDEIVKTEIADGNVELNIRNNPREALVHYHIAQQQAPRRGSIRAKIEEAEKRAKE